MSLQKKFLPKLSPKVIALHILEDYLEQRVCINHIKPIQGGWRNAIYLLPSHRLVVKIFRERATQQEIDNYEVEISSLKLHENCGCKVPRLLYTNSVFRSIIMGYINGHNLEQIANPPYIEVAKLIADTHSRLSKCDLSMTKFGYRSPIIDFFDGLKMITELGGREYMNMEKIAKEIASYFRQVPKQIVIGSFTPSNIISSQGSLYHVDLERTTIASPTLDLAYFFAFARPSSNIRVGMIKEYNSILPIEYELYEITSLHTVIICTLFLGVFLKDIKEGTFNHKKRQVILKRINDMTNELINTAEAQSFYGYVAKKIVSLL